VSLILKFTVIPHYSRWGVTFGRFVGGWEAQIQFGSVLRISAQGYRS
jgi:hypothetical protein